MKRYHCGHALAMLGEVSRPSMYGVAYRVGEGLFLRQFISLSRAHVLRVAGVRPPGLGLALGGAVNASRGGSQVRIRIGASCSSTGAKSRATPELHMVTIGYSK